MLTHPLRFAAGFCLSLGLCAAQLPVTLTGRIDRATAPCNAAATHKVGCTEVLLRSDTVDLSAMEGTFRAITGVSEGAAPCVTVNVTEASDAAAFTTTFSLGGYRLGTNVTFTTLSPAGSVVFYFFADAPGFFPLLTFGTLLLDPAANFLYFTNDISIGVAIRTVRIPTYPELVGRTILFQTAMVALVPPDARMLNAHCFVVRQ
jgi:hypothetical protein